MTEEAGKRNCPKPVARTKSGATQAPVVHPARLAWGMPPAAASSTPSESVALRHTAAANLGQRPVFRPKLIKI